MGKHPGHVEVTTEVGFCNFCNRTRNLRREEHQLGELVRAIVTCETCHRTLSNTIGVAQPDEATPVAVEAPVEEKVAGGDPKPAPARRATRPRAIATPRKRRTPSKPTSTAARRAPKKK